MLWLGGQLPNSLINPNQLNAFGHASSNNPTSDTKNFGIQILDQDFIQFRMSDTIIYLTTQVPTDEEINSCRRIYLTDDSSLDPDKVEFHQLCSVRRTQPQEEATHLTEISHTLNNQLYVTRMISKVNIRLVPSTAQVSSVGVASSHSAVTPEEVP